MAAIGSALLIALALTSFAWSRLQTGTALRTGEPSMIANEPEENTL